MTKKDDRKTDIWAIVSAVLTVISLIFIRIFPIGWILISPLALIAAIYSLIRIKRHENLKGKFWDFLAIINFGFLLIFIILLITSIDIQCN